MLQITKKADYAVRLMLEVALHSGGAITTAEIAERQDIPYQFLRKVALAMASRGLLVSERGGKGGLTLARPAEDISVLDVLRALDLPPINDCAIDPHNCSRREACAVFPVWFEAQRELERVFGGMPLSKLVRAHRAIHTHDGGETAHERDSKSPIPMSRMAHETRN